MFVQPRVERPAPKPPDRARAVRLDRMAAIARARAEADNPLPFSRGNTPGARRRAAERRPRAAGAAARSGRRPAERRDAAATDAEAARVAVGAADAAAAAAGAAERRQRALGDRRRIARRCAAQPAALRAERVVRQPGRRRRAVRPGDSVRHQGRRVRAVDPPLHRAGEAQLVHPLRGDVDEGARRHHVQRAQGRLDHRPAASSGRAPIDAFNNAAFGALSASNPTQPLPPEYPADKAFFTVTFFYNETPPR